MACCMGWPRPRRYHRSSNGQRTGGDSWPALKAPVHALLLHFRLPGDSRADTAPLPSSNPNGDRSMRPATAAIPAGSLSLPYMSTNPAQRPCLPLAPASAMRHATEGPPLSRAVEPAGLFASLVAGSAAPPAPSAAAALVAAPPQPVLSLGASADGWWRQSCLILSALPVSVTIFDREGQVVFQNAASVEYFGQRVGKLTDGAANASDDADAAAAAAASAVAAATTRRLSGPGSNWRRRLLPLDRSPTDPLAALRPGSNGRAPASRGLLSTLLSSARSSKPDRERGAAGESGVSQRHRGEGPGVGDEQRRCARDDSWSRGEAITAAGAYTADLDGAGAADAGADPSAGLLLLELFALEPAKLEAMWAATAADGGTWQGIVRVPRLLNPDAVTTTSGGSGSCSITYSGRVSLLRTQDTHGDRQDDVMLQGDPSSSAQHAARVAASARATQASPPAPSSAAASAAADFGNGGSPLRGSSSCHRLMAPPTGEPGGGLAATGSHRGSRNATPLGALDSWIIDGASARTEQSRAALSAAPRNEPSAAWGPGGSGVGSAPGRPLSTAAVRGPLPYNGLQPVPSDPLSVASTALLPLPSGEMADPRRAAEQQESRDQKSSTEAGLLTATEASSAPTGKSTEVTNVVVTDAVELGSSSAGRGGSVGPVEGAAGVTTEDLAADVIAAARGDGDGGTSASAGTGPATTTTTLTGTTLTATACRSGPPDTGAPAAAAAGNAASIDGTASASASYSLRPYSSKARSWHMQRDGVLRGGPKVPAPAGGGAPEGTSMSSGRTPALSLTRVPYSSLLTKILAGAASSPAASSPAASAADALVPADVADTDGPAALYPYGSDVAVSPQGTRRRFRSPQRVMPLDCNGPAGGEVGHEAGMTADRDSARPDTGDLLPAGASRSAASSYASRLMGSSWQSSVFRSFTAGVRRLAGGRTGGGGNSGPESRVVRGAGAAAVGASSGSTAVVAAGSSGFTIGCAGRGSSGSTLGAIGGRTGWAAAAGGAHSGLPAEDANVTATRLARKGSNVGRGSQVPVPLARTPSTLADVPSGGSGDGSGGSLADVVGRLPSESRGSAWKAAAGSGGSSRRMPRRTVSAGCSRGEGPGVDGSGEQQPQQHLQHLQQPVPPGQQRSGRSGEQQPLQHLQHLQQPVPPGQQRSGEQQRVSRSRSRSLRLSRRYASMYSLNTSTWQVAFRFADQTSVAGGTPSLPPDTFGTDAPGPRLTGTAYDSLPAAALAATATAPPALMMTAPTDGSDSCAVGLSSGALKEALESGPGSQAPWQQHAPRVPASAVPQDLDFPAQHRHRQLGSDANAVPAVAAVTSAARAFGASLLMSADNSNATATAGVGPGTGISPGGLDSDPATDKLRPLPSDLFSANSSRGLSRGQLVFGTRAGRAAPPGPLLHAPRVPPAPAGVVAGLVPQPMALGQMLLSSFQSMSSEAASRGSRRLSIDSNLTVALASNISTPDRSQLTPSQAVAASPGGATSGVASRVVAFAASLRTAPMLPKGPTSLSRSRSDRRGKRPTSIGMTSGLAQASSSMHGIMRSVSVTAGAPGGVLASRLELLSARRTIGDVQERRELRPPGEDVYGSDGAGAAGPPAGVATAGSRASSVGMIAAAAAAGRSRGLHHPCSPLLVNPATLVRATVEGWQSSRRCASTSNVSSVSSADRGCSRTGAEVPGVVGGDDPHESLHGVAAASGLLEGPGPLVDGTLEAEADLGSLPRSTEPVGMPVGPTLVDECWHEVVAGSLVDPVSGVRAVVVMQRDVSAKVVAERHVAQVSETEHRLLEQIFPRHVLQYIMEEAGMGTIQTANDSSTGTDHPPLNANNNNKNNNDNYSNLSAYSPRSGAGRPGSGLLSSSQAGWRPHVRDCNRLATWHPKVTILFADIQGFTPMCKVLPPRVVMSFLNQLFTRFDAMLDEHRVYKVETIGDCYMVAGGLIREDEDGMAAVHGGGQVDLDQAANVFAFAKAMLRAASCVRLPTTGQPVKVRVGIHSGPVVSGVVGTRMPRFCLFGDTVNTASRMESTGVPGAIHASEDCLQTLRDYNPTAAEGWAPTGGIEVKGKGLMRTFLWSFPGNADAAAQPGATAAPPAAAADATAGRSGSGGGARPLSAATVGQCGGASTTGHGAAGGYVAGGAPGGSGGSDQQQHAAARPMPPASVARANRRDRPREPSRLAMMAPTIPTDDVQPSETELVSARGQQGGHEAGPAVATSNSAVVSPTTTATATAVAITATDLIAAATAVAGAGSSGGGSGGESPSGAAAGTAASGDFTVPPVTVPYMGPLPLNSAWLPMGKNHGKPGAGAGGKSVLARAGVDDEDGQGSHGWGSHTTDSGGCGSGCGGLAGSKSPAMAAVLAACGGGAAAASAAAAATAFEGGGGTGGDSGGGGGAAAASRAAAFLEGSGGGFFAWDAALRLRMDAMGMLREAAAAAEGHRQGQDRTASSDIYIHSWSQHHHAAELSDSAGSAGAPDQAPSRGAAARRSSDDGDTAESSFRFGPSPPHLDAFRRRENVGEHAPPAGQRAAATSLAASAPLQSAAAADATADGASRRGRASAAGAKAPAASHGPRMWHLDDAATAPPPLTPDVRDSSQRGHVPGPGPADGGVGDGSDVDSGMNHHCSGSRVYGGGASGRGGAGGTVGGAGSVADGRAFMAAAAAASLPSVDQAAIFSSALDTGAALEAGQGQGQGHVASTCSTMMLADLLGLMDMFGSLHGARAEGGGGGGGGGGGSSAGRGAEAGSRNGPGSRPGGAAGGGAALEGVVVGRADGDGGGGSSAGDPAMDSCSGSDPAREVRGPLRAGGGSAISALRLPSDVP